MPKFLGKNVESGVDKNTILQYKLLYRKLRRKAYGEQNSQRSNVPK